MADCAIYVLWDSKRRLVLVEDRPDMRPHSQHYWVFPGGKVEEGESHKAAMIRECQEETGCTPSRYEPLCEPFENPESGYIVAPFFVTAWEPSTVPETTYGDRQAPLDWKDPRMFHDNGWGFSARAKIAEMIWRREWHRPAA